MSSPSGSSSGGSSGGSGGGVASSGGGVASSGGSGGGAGAPTMPNTSTGSLFGSAITSLYGFNTALWNRLETYGDVSDDAMSLASLTLEDTAGPSVQRSMSMDSRDFESLDEQIASDAARMSMTAAVPTATARPPRVVAGSSSLSSETIHEGLDVASDSSCPSVDSFVQLDDARGGGPTVGYCYFKRQEDAVVQTKAPDGTLLRNHAPVFAKPVHCDAVVWSPILGNDGAVGHCFFLEFQGAQQARVESFFGDDATASCAPTRIAVVNALSTPMAMAAKLVDRGSMVEFSPPCRHAAKLKRLLDKMTSSNNEDDLYLPVKELVLGPALKKDQFRQLLKLPPHLTTHTHSEHAARAWEQTVDLLRGVSDETRRGIAWHNKRELAGAQKHAAK